MPGFKKYDRSKLGRDSDRPERSGFGRRERSDAPRYGGRSSDRPRGGFGDRDKPYQEQFDVICDKCGKECKVPFKPTRGKPVFCSECFSKKEEGGEFRGGGSSSRDLEEINEKLDKIMRALKID
ncbi:MAG: CxxC-x17-CxxC domain-containing protein [Candidatus Woesearchaeota archaeon]|jgi:CxxC-x17-CxxC domain-containing protein